MSLLLPFKAWYMIRLAAIENNSIAHVSSQEDSQVDLLSGPFCAKRCAAFFSLLLRLAFNPAGFYYQYIAVLVLFPSYDANSLFFYLYTALHIGIFSIGSTIIRASLQFTKQEV
jgi:hypothetical protein